MTHRILKLPELIKTTGLSGPSIYRLAAQGQFPKPIKLGVRSSGWILAEVEEWLKQRITSSRHKAQDENP